MSPRRLARIAHLQCGLFTRAQARECGYSSYQIRRRISTGEWQLIGGSALAFRGLKATPWLRDVAAHLSVRGSVLAGPSAARAWGIAVPDTRPCLLVGPHGNSRVDGVVLLHDTPDARDLRRIEGIPITGRERTIVDCLIVLPERAGTDLLDRALQRGWLPLDDLARRTAARVGRRGTTKLLRHLRSAGDGTRSAAERRLAKLMRDAGVTGWRANVAISDRLGLIGLGDIVFEDIRLVIELDGWAFHTTPDRFQRDRTRQNRLVAAGWTVLRFTWHDLTTRPVYVVATVRAMMTALHAAGA